ncbi:MAG: MlaA family lipoprotein, partial [Alphaproteobacteria bacterium]
MNDLIYFPRRISTAALTGIAASFMTVMAAQTVSAAEKAGADVVYTDMNDPFEPMNRAIFSFNLGFDKVILRPVAVAYRFVVPSPARKSATNFLDNLESPVIFLNDILQAKPGRAGTTLARFGINTVIGFFG